MEKNKIMLTHIDMDGAGCAIVMKLAFPNMIVKHCGYSTLTAKITDMVKAHSDYKIYITDLNVSAADIEILEQSKVDYTIIDHHLADAAIDREKLGSKMIVNTSYCATIGVFQYIKKVAFNNNINAIPYSKQVQQLIKYIDDYDMWTHKHPFSRKLNYIFDALGLFGFILAFRNGMPEKNNIVWSTYNGFVTLAENQLRDAINKANKNKMIDDDNGLNSVVFFLDNYKYLNDICEHYLNCGHTLVYAIFTHTLNKVSVRVNKDFDIAIGDILREIGGGGHSKAGGFAGKITDENVLKTMTNIEKIDNLFEAIDTVNKLVVQKTK